MHRAFVKTGKIESKIVHTGQHFDFNMSGIFWQQLEIPEPNYHLNINSVSPNEQIAKIMLALEPIIEAEKPQLIIVVGDVNSTLAGALTAAKMNIPLAHIEAGLRNFDRKMPEELNRVLTDQLADYLFITEKSALKNLKKEGIDERKISFAGNCMIDSLVQFLPKTKSLSLEAIFGEKIKKNDYILMTIHRPANVDDKESLIKCISLIKIASELKTVVLPLHPRTKKNLMRFGLFDSLQRIENLTITQPLGYLEFLAALDNCCIVISDSGGIQEEATFLKKPCITLRDSTERPVTISEGTNRLAKNLDANLLEIELQKILNGKKKKCKTPLFWDGKAAERIADYLLTHINSN